MMLKMHSNIRIIIIIIIHSNGLCGGICDVRKVKMRATFGELVIPSRRRSSLLLLLILRMMMMMMVVSSVGCLN